MAEQQVAGSAGEMMVFGLIEQADRIGKSALATQQDLAEQIEHLGQVQEWAVKAAVELQKQAAAVIKNLEGERARLQSVGPTLQQNAAWAMRETIREHSDKIETQISAGMAIPLDQIKQAAAQVRQNISEISWLVRSLILAAGIVIGLALGWLPFRSSLNHLQEQEDRIEQYLATQQQQQAAPVTPEPSHASAHKGKK
jgi:hypothetical protein